MPALETYDIFGVIRNTGSGWFIIDDTDHTPLNITGISTVSGSSGYVRIFYKEAVRIGSLIPGADETYAGTVHPGASVDFGHADIYFRNSSGTIIDPTTLTDPHGNIWIMGQMLCDPAGTNSAFSCALSADENVWSGYTLRMVIPAAQISCPTGTQIFTRLTMMGPVNSESTQIGECYIGHRASSGNAWDFASTPVAITANSLTSFTLPLSGQIVSDALPFVWDKSSDIVISWYFSGDSSHDTIRRLTDGGNCSLYYKAAANNAATVNPSGFSASGHNPSTVAIVSNIAMDGF